MASSTFGVSKNVSLTSIQKFYILIEHFKNSSEIKALLSPSDAVLYDLVCKKVKELHSTIISPRPEAYEKANKEFVAYIEELKEMSEQNNTSCSRRFFPSSPPRFFMQRYKQIMQESWVKEMQTTNNSQPSMPQ